MIKNIIGHIKKASDNATNYKKKKNTENSFKTNNTNTFNNEKNTIDNDKESLSKEKQLKNSLSMIHYLTKDNKKLTQLYIIL